MVSSKKVTILSLALIVSYSYMSGMEAKLWYQESDSVLASRINADGVSELEMKMCYNSCSDQLKGLVEHLKDPNYKNDPWFRSALFYGDPGTGKSTTAHAIARYADWDCIFKRPSDFQKGNRGEAAQNFRTMMETIVSGGAESLVVIDEANGLWENTESKNHDNAETAMEVWQWITKLNGNNRVFMILIANRIHKMPIQLKSRLIDHMYKFTTPISNYDRYKSFEAVCKFNKFNLSSDGLVEGISMVTNNPKWNARDYRGIVSCIQDHVRYILKKKPEGTITADIIKEVIKERKEREKDIQYYDLELSETDRQDLYQVQNMWSNILIQRLQKFSVLGRTPGITQSTGNFIMDHATTQNQQRVAGQLLDVSALREQHIFVD